MVDFDFYRNSYLGSSIPEKQFPAYALRAEAELDAMKRKYRVASSGQESEKLALCAMAEAIAAAAKRKGVSTATVGSVSVRYENQRELKKELRHCAEIYLDIYRGVSSL